MLQVLVNLLVSPKRYGLLLLNMDSFVQVRLLTYSCPTTITTHLEHDTWFWQKLHLYILSLDDVHGL